MKVEDMKKTCDKEIQHLNAELNISLDARNTSNTIKTFCFMRESKNSYLRFLT